MNYDVFISYSRADKAVADQICRAFDEVGITYFIDRKGIGAAREFPDVIANAIKQCRKMLFLASANSYKLKFTKREIYFALKVKDEGDIMPYCIDDAQMPDTIDFVFCTTNYRNIKDHPIKPVLVNDMLQMLGGSVGQKAANDDNTTEEIIYPEIADLPKWVQAISFENIGKMLSALGSIMKDGLSWIAVVFIFLALLFFIMFMIFAETQ